VRAALRRLSMEFCLSPSSPPFGESFGGGSHPCEGDKCERYKLDVAIREEIANMQER
jgi:hypothetical protein